MGASAPLVDLSLDPGRQTRQFLLHALLTKISLLKTEIECSDPRPQTKKEKLLPKRKWHLSHIVTEKHKKAPIRLHGNKNPKDRPRTKWIWTTPRAKSELMNNRHQYCKTISCCWTKTGIRHYTMKQKKDNSDNTINDQNLLTKNAHSSQIW